MKAGVALSLAAIVLIAAGLISRNATSPTPGYPAQAPPAAIATPAASAWRAGFLPLLEAVAAEAERLAEMGESRERNLLRIRAGQDAMNAALADADAWLAAHPPDEPNEAAIASYRDGSTAIREAMAEARAGFLRLDFDRVARATETMREGETALRHALTLLAE